jgi:hypothetical protein
MAEPGSERPRGRFDDHTGVDTDVGNVGDGPSGRCDLHAESRRYFFAPQRNGRRVELEAGRGRGVPRPVLTGQREVKRVRVRRREVIKRERGVVGHDRVVRSEPEPRRNDFVVRTGWHADKAVEATADPFKVAGRDMVQEAASAVAQLARLCRGEVATLRRCQFEEPRELIRPRGTGCCPRHVPYSIRPKPPSRDTMKTQRL